MEEANKRINQILAMDEEDYTDEIIEEFVVRNSLFLWKWMKSP